MQGTSGKVQVEENAGLAVPTDEDIDNMIINSADINMQPCCINHDLTNALVQLCLDNPLLIERVASRLLVILGRSQDRLVKNAIAEIVIMMLWLSFKTNNPVFPIKFVSDKDLPFLELLKEAFNIYEDMTTVQWGTTLTGNDADLGDGFIMRALNRNVYLIEHNNRFVAVAGAILTTSDNSLFLSISTFCQNFYERVKTWCKIVDWAAQQAGEVNYVALRYPLTKPQLSLLLHCQARGIFEYVETVIADFEDAMKFNSSGQDWQRIESRGRMPVELAPACNLFVRGRVLSPGPVPFYRQR